MMQHSPGGNHSATGKVYLFGEFELNPDRGALLKNGVELPLRRQCFQVLKYLVEHRGVLVPKHELMAAVWCDVIVTESSLTQCILTIRRTLGDDSKVFVRSIPRSGYLFDYPVEVRRTSPDVALLASPPKMPVRRRFLFRYPAAFFLLVISALVFVWSTDPHAPAILPLPAITAPLPTSIAVLPFEDASPSKDQELIADGISEGLLNVLARNPNLIVIAKSSAFSFKGMNKDTKSIATRLNVANVLEGSVHRNENQLRVVVRLVSAKENNSLWAQTYDLDANDFHWLQNEIANSVASVLGVEQPENISVAASKHEALNAYLIARHLHGRRAPGDLERSIGQFRSAVEIDAGFTNAWVGLAGALWTYAGEQPALLGPINKEMKHALEKALELDPNNPEANARIAKYYWDVGQDSLAERHFEQALEFGQNTPQVLASAAGFAFRDMNYEAAVEIQRRVTMLDPLSFTHQVNLALFLRYAGRLDESIAEYEVAFDLNPDAAIEYREDYAVTFLLDGRYDQAETLALQLPEVPARDHLLAMVYLALDQPSRSEEMIRRLTTENSADTALRLAEYYAYAGDIDRAFHWLKQARNRQAGVVLHPAANTYFEVFLHSPFLQELARDARWPAWRTYVENQLRAPAMSVNTRQMVMRAH